MADLQQPGLSLNTSLNVNNNDCKSEYCSFDNSPIVKINADKEVSSATQAATRAAACAAIAADAASNSVITENMRLTAIFKEKF